MALTVTPLELSNERGRFTSVYATATATAGTTTLTNIAIPSELVNIEFILGVPYTINTNGTWNITAFPPGNFTITVEIVGYGK